MAKIPLVTVFAISVTLHRSTVTYNGWLVKIFVTAILCYVVSPVELCFGILYNYGVLNKITLHYVHEPWHTIHSDAEGSKIVELFRVIAILPESFDSKLQLLQSGYSSYIATYLKVSLRIVNNSDWLNVYTNHKAEEDMQIYF